jgi:hypothetical protein
LSLLCHDLYAADDDSIYMLPDAPLPGVLGHLPASEQERQALARQLLLQLVQDPGAVATLSAWLAATVGRGAMFDFAGGNEGLHLIFFAILVLAVLPPPLLLCNLFACCLLACFPCSFWRAV